MAATSCRSSTRRELPEALAGRVLRQQGLARRGTPIVLPGIFTPADPAVLRLTASGQLRIVFLRLSLNLFMGALRDGCTVVRLPM